MGEIGLIADGAMIVRDGKIEAVGPQDEIEWIAPADADYYDAGGRLVTPGLVDAHTHLVFGGDRLDDFEARSQGKTYVEIATAGGGIWRTVGATRPLTTEELAKRASHHFDLLRRHGTTVAESKTGYVLDRDGELRSLRALQSLRSRIVPTLLAAHAYPKDQDPQAYLDMVCDELVPLAAREGLARDVDIFVEEGYFSHEDAERLALAARAHGLGLRMHVDQLADSGGAGLAARLGARTADHLEHTGADGIAALAEAGVTPVLLPGSVWGLGLSRYPLGREMVDAGLPVVLATDFNPGSSPVPSLPFCMALACRFMRMTPAECLTAVTVNAAATLGLEASRGALMPGMVADFVVWEAEDYRELAYWPDVARPKDVSGNRLDLC
jgi:imidazolonepropionase